jgi:hypothetical protein
MLYHEDRPTGLTTTVSNGRVHLETGDGRQWFSVPIAAGDEISVYDTHYTNPQPFAFETQWLRGQMRAQGITPEPLTQTDEYRFPAEAGDLAEDESGRVVRYDGQKWLAVS